MFALSTLFALAWLAPLTTATVYSLTAFSPDQPIDGLAINAAGAAFYTGMDDKPATFCPDEVEKVGVGCPPVLGTLVGDLLSGMAVAVPGGQQIYIEEFGAVKYTVAHSNTIPPTAMTGGWFNKTMLSNCAPNATVVDWISPTPSDQTQTGGLFLCNATTEDVLVPDGATYQLYAWTWFFNRTDCYDVIGLLEKGVDAKYGAWQYT